MSASLQQAPPPGDTNPSPRRLHLYYTSSFTQRQMVVTDSDKTTALYDVSQRSSWSMFSSKPHMTITRCSDNSEIGTVTFHSFSAPELTIHGRSISLDHVSWISRGRTFPSAATGTTLAWQYDSAVGNSMTCTDETDQWFARCTSSHFSLSKGGVLELASPAVDGILLDELVVTVLAVLQERKRRERSSSAASGG